MPDLPMPRFPAVLALLASLAALCSCAGTDGVPGSGAQADQPSEAFRARGNEPGWLLDIDRGEMTLISLYGAKRLVAPTPAPHRTAAFTRYVAKADSTDFTVTVFDRLCRDTMTGMPHPNAVEVLLDGRKLTGCGGDPVSLLQGREWVVEDVDGARLTDGSRATLNFGENARVSGRASCNAYTGQYSLSGEGLSISKTAGTMMACEPPLMRQEDLFLGVLHDVRRFDFRPDGALLLQTDDRRTITARR
jgi:heat shock protein HslJ